MKGRKGGYFHDVHVDDAVAVTDFGFRKSGGWSEWDRNLLIEASVDQSSLPFPATFQPCDISKHIVLVDEKHFERLMMRIAHNNEIVLNMLNVTLFVGSTLDEERRFLANATLEENLR